MYAFITDEDDGQTVVFLQGYFVYTDLVNSLCLVSGWVSPAQALQQGCSWLGVTSFIGDVSQ